MNAICGPLAGNSLKSAVLQELLENRLRQKTDVDGSILYRLTWREWILPSGRRICALRGSGKRISVKGSILQGWPTTTTRDWKDGPATNEPGVPTNSLLGRDVWLAGWGTPTSQPANSTPENFINRKIASMERGNRPMGLSCTEIGVQAQLAGWPTPCTQDGPNGGPGQGSDRLPGAAAAAWAIRGKLQADGSMLIGSCAEILAENQAGGPLNPEHSRWLMGFPPEWTNCVPTGTRSIGRRRKHSAKPCGKSAVSNPVGSYDL